LVNPAVTWTSTKNGLADHVIFLLTFQIQDIFFLLFGFFCSAVYLFCSLGSGVIDAVIHDHHQHACDTEELFPAREQYAPCLAALQVPHIELGQRAVGTKK
jgi:hypothetical protein